MVTPLPLGTIVIAVAMVIGRIVVGTVLTGGILTRSFVFELAYSAVGRIVA